MASNNFDFSLTNPVWYCLNQAQKQYLITINDVRFYDPEICPFGGFIDVTKTKTALNEYSKLTDSFFLVSEDKTPIFDTKIILLEKKLKDVK